MRLTQESNRGGGKNVWVAEEERVVQRVHMSLKQRRAKNSACSACLLPLEQHILQCTYLVLLWHCRQAAAALGQNCYLQEKKISKRNEIPSGKSSVSLLHVCGDFLSLDIFRSVAVVSLFARRRLTARDAGGCRRPAGSRFVLVPVQCKTATCRVEMRSPIVPFKEVF